MNEASNLKERFADALERLDGDFKLLCDMASVTLPDIPAVLEQIEADLQRGDDAAAASSLHKLKGMLSTYDSDGVVLEIQEMLAMARRGQVGECQTLYHHELPKIKSLIQEIEHLSRQA